MDSNNRKKEKRVCSGHHTSQNIAMCFAKKLKQFLRTYPYLKSNIAFLINSKNKSHRPKSQKKGIGFKSNKQGLCWQAFFSKKNDRKKA